MILFDYLIGRKYRGLDYYLITTIDELGIPVWTDAHLSPISVSNSIDKDNQVKIEKAVISNVEIINGNLGIFKGGVFENIVAQGLTDNELDIYYYQKADNLEIDFITYFINE